MNVDKAVGCVYSIVGHCKDSPDYEKGLEALKAIEDAVEALNKSQRILLLTLQGDFDKELHGCMLANVIAENRHLLSP